MPSRSIDRPDRPPRRAAARSGGLLALLLLVAGCSGEAAVPIDPANPPPTSVDPTEVTHQIEPTDEMRDAATQQCLDDPVLAEGYVRAVEPDTDRVLSEVTVDCDEVRAGS